MPRFFPDYSLDRRTRWYPAAAFTLTLPTESSRVRRRSARAGSVVNHRPAGWGKPAGADGRSLPGRTGKGGQGCSRRNCGGGGGWRPAWCWCRASRGSGPTPWACSAGRPGRTEPRGQRGPTRPRIMRQAREAYDAQNYGQGPGAGRKGPRSPGAGGVLRRSAGRHARATCRRKPGRQARPGRPPRPRPARPTTDPTVLMTWPSRPWTRATWTRPRTWRRRPRRTGANVRWGLFDDTPASLLKDIQKARGRRDRDMCRAAPGRGPDPGREAGRDQGRAGRQPDAPPRRRPSSRPALHGAYSMWDFGDRPGRRDRRCPQGPREGEARSPVKAPAADLPGRHVAAEGADGLRRPQTAGRGRSRHDRRDGADGRRRRPQESGRRPDAGRQGPRSRRPLRRGP